MSELAIDTKIIQRSCEKKAAQYEIDYETESCALNLFLAT